MTDESCTFIHSIKTGYVYPRHQDRYIGQPSLLLNGYRRHFLWGEAGVNVTTTIQCLGKEYILLHPYAPINHHGAMFKNRDKFMCYGSGVWSVVDCKPLETEKNGGKTFQRTVLYMMYRCLNTCSRNELILIELCCLILLQPIV